MRSAGDSCAALTSARTCALESEEGSTFERGHRVLVATWVESSPAPGGPVVPGKPGQGLASCGRL
eukprot:scaffold17787_cov56-Phaeocystis_antarctica.AAC.5